MAENNHTTIQLLIITWNFPPKRGGMENLVGDLYKNLSRHVDVKVIAPTAKCSVEDPNIYRPKGSSFLSFCFSAFFSGSRILLHEKRQLFGGSLVVLPVLIMLKLIFRVPTVCYAHGLDVIYNKKLYPWILRLFLPHLDAVICNSNNTKRLITTKVPKNKINVEVIPPGIDVTPYLRKNTEPPFETTYILTIGRLTKRKGIVPFIQNCFAELTQQFPELAYIIVGEEPKKAMFHQGGYRKCIEDCISELGLETHVHLRGWEEQNVMIPLLQHCAALVFPVIPVEGDVEGFGMVALEAGAAGVPTITFNRGGVADAVIHNKTGVLISNTDYHEMQRTLSNILQGNLRMDNISHEIDQRYSWSLIVPRYLRLFQILEPNG